MAFFDNFSKKISEVAGNAADKAKDLGEIAKLKAEIMKKQNQANSELLDLGKMVYENAKADTASSYAEQCDSITACYASIEDLRARIALVKSDNNDDAPEEAAPTEKYCPACGEKAAADAKFCGKCGAAL